MSKSPRPPEPTRCVNRKCRFSCGSRFIVCPFCKTPQPPFDKRHAGDTCVGLAALVIGIFFCLLAAGGFA